jgi:hypothetical protein
VARPPLILYKFSIQPSHDLTANGDLTSDGYFRASLMIVNETEPPDELHNLTGEFWTDSRFIYKASLTPTREILSGVYYQFSIPMLHKKSGIVLAQWHFRPPRKDEKIPLAYRAVASEVDWKSESWLIVNDNNKYKIIPAQ